MSKRVIAFAARVSCLSTDSAEKCKKKTSEQNAFLNRSRQATSDVYQFSMGWNIIDTLIADQGKAIDDIRIHDHGFYGGIIGDGYNLGMYTETYHNSEGESNILFQQSTAGNFAYRVSLGVINLAKSCSIVIYGCNCSPFAQELSMYLGQSGRPDISITGADNNVYEKNGRAHVDSSTTGVNSGKKPGMFFTYKAWVQVSAHPTWSYR